MNNKKGKVIVIGSRKGGVGKSTIAINLAGGLKNRFPNSTVKIIDCDEGCSTSRWYDVRLRRNKILTESGQEELASIECDYFNSNKSIAHKLRYEREINDFIIVDASRAFDNNNAFESAFLVSDMTYIPYTASRIDLLSLAPTINELRIIEERLRQQMIDAGGSYDTRDVRIIMNRVDNYKLQDITAVARKLVSDFVSLCSVSSAEIPERSAFIDATDKGLTVHELKTRSSYYAKASIDLLIAEILGERDIRLERVAS